MNYGGISDLQVVPWIAPTAKRGHPSAKPPEIYSRILGWSARPGDIVVTGGDGHIRRLEEKSDGFVLQGGRDYEVTSEDFEGWKTGLEGRADVRFESYPDCDHLFVEGSGKSLPDDPLRRTTDRRARTFHVASYVVEEIAAWINDRPDRTARR